MIKRTIIIAICSVFLFLTMTACHITEPPCPAYAYYQDQTSDNS